MHDRDAASEGFRQDAVAIIGLACRFPGADDPSKFWRNLVDGVDSVTRWRMDAGDDDGHVAARAVLADVDRFDARFFRFTPKQAEIADPQLRLALECAWLALETANCGPADPERLVGVYMGASLSTYLLGHVLPQHAAVSAGIGDQQILFGNDKDFYPTTISHRLDLKGPSVNISTACSTGLVAVHAACQALATYQCDVALAGASSLLLPQDAPRYEQGGIYARDGHCRAFDADAGGTVGGSGCGFVALKRIDDALRDGDFIHAVILGGAVNNDGADKVSYAAPSASGQRTVIEQALANAGIDATGISLVEGHGTGTLLGDAVELEALDAVFAAAGVAPGACALGSVKTNIGHLDAAAGMAGLIKVVLALQHRVIPPSLHFRRPNPQGPLEGSAFHVPVEATPWSDRGSVRRAGVSAFGIGGTNAHLILQEAPTLRSSRSSRPWQIVPLSAPSASARSACASALADYLRDTGDDDALADVAYTLGACRHLFDHRVALVARDRLDLIEQLTTGGGDAVATTTLANPRVTFVFPDLDASAFSVFAAAFAAEAAFRRAVDACVDAAQAHLGAGAIAIRDAFVRATLPEEPALREAALFSSLHAMARLWMHWGVRPVAATGRGIGARAAACLAGTCTLAQALSAATIKPATTRAMATGIALLAPEGAPGGDNDRSPVVPPTIATGEDVAADHVALSFATRSSVGDGWALCLSVWSPDGVGSTDARALYAGLATAWTHGLPVDWAAFHGDEPRHRLPIPTMPFARSSHWLTLPESPSTSVDATRHIATTDDAATDARPDVADWSYVPVWKRCLAPATPLGAGTKRWLLLSADDPFCAAFSARLRNLGHAVVEVFQGDAFEAIDHRRLRMDPARPADHDALFAALASREALPDRIVHLWSLADAEGADALSARVDAGLASGLHALLFLVQALGRADITRPMRLVSIYADAHDVCGGRTLQPQRTTLVAALKIVPQEYPNLACSGIDIGLPEPGSVIEARLIDRLIADCDDDASDPIAAYREDVRWVPAYEQVRLPAQGDGSRVKEGGVYLITGGLGGIGLALAGHLARTARCDLALIGRSPFPPEERWEALAGDMESEDPERTRIARGLLALREHGCRVKLCRADVADRDAIATAIADIERDFGAIRGVIHAAGVADTAGVIQNRSREATEDALSAKVRGAIHLDELLRGRPLDFFVLCSSIGSVLHALKFGEVGYVAANDFLDAFASRRHAREPGLTVSINWTDWVEAGMSARARARLPQHAADPAPGDSASTHPLLGRRRSGAIAGEWVFENTLRAKELWVLDGHRIAGIAVLPGTAYIELAFAAFASATDGRSAEIRDLSLASPLVVPDEGASELRVLLTPRQQGFSFRVEARDARRAGDWTVHARGEIAALAAGDGDASTPLPVVALQPTDTRHAARDKGDDSAGMRFGGRWRSFAGVAFGPGAGTASLRLADEYDGDLDRYLLHPALLDCAVSFLIPALLEPGSDPYVPLHYRSIRIRRPGRLPAQLTAHARSEQTAVRDGGALTLDARLVDAEGTVWVEVLGMTARRNALAAPTATEASAELAEHASPRCHLLDIGSVGHLGTLRFVPIELPPLGPQEVEVEIQAAALNFKDVLVALGMVPPPPGARGRFGLEFAGRVSRLGRDVRGLSPGDEVMGFGGSWVAPRAIYPAAWLRRRPAGLSVEQAAGSPVAFTIAQLALREIGGLRRGESVLIHSATGGVGLAAVQVAQEVGAVIHATAGSDAKRAHLRALGIEHVHDSRSLAFVDDILARSDGVDVVLNSLGSQLARASLDLLRPQGRFLELGLGNDHLASVAQGAGKHFLPIVVDTRDPGLERAWSETVAHLADGRWTPLPTRLFGIDRLVDAFEYMAAARHVGKIVVTYDRWKDVEQPQANAASGDASRSEEAFFRDLLRGMSSREGTEIFDRILHADFPRVVVSTQPLQPLIERSRTAGRLGVGAFLAGENLSVAARDRPDLATPLHAPEDDTQTRLVRIWKDLLGVRDVGIHDDFFDLGGDSLSAIRLLSRCREEFHVDQTLASLLDHPTIARLSVRIAQLRDAAEPVRADGAENETIII
ncbi:MAG: SDR family oxidoreductase [Pseudomonadota bacterium]